MKEQPRREMKWLLDKYTSVPIKDVPKWSRKLENFANCHREQFNEDDIRLMGRFA